MASRTHVLDVHERAKSGVSPSIGGWWSVAAVAAVWLLLLYAGIALPLERWIPLTGSKAGALLGAVIALAAAWAAVRLLPVKAENTVLLCGSLLICFLTLDVASAAYLNLSPRYRGAPDIFAGRDADPQTWIMEMLPKTYYPTGGNFFLYKPLQTIAGVSYGENYSPAMLRHKELRENVLKLRPVEYRIDGFGFRNTVPPSDSAVFTLGDSICFGYHVTQRLVFQQMLGAALGEPVYNLGVSGTSPWQQYQLLSYLLRTKRDEFRPKHVLWLVFEGNDLEEDYSPGRPTPEYVQSTASKAFRHTLVETVTSLPQRVSEQSFLRFVTTGSIRFRTPGQSGADHYVVDGERLAFPLYRSPLLGSKLFRPVYLERATQPASYVLQHPNAPRLRETFYKMRDLSREFGFQVTVVIVPSDVRVYKDAFEDLPPVSREPHLIRYFMQLAQESGLPSVNLNDRMAPYARTEMLYHRDDTHWNERGHAVVAEILTKVLLAAKP